MSEAGGGDLFIVDNSASGWTGLEYLRQWSDLARSFDIATGFFEIGALLALDGKWQQLERIRLLMGDEVSLRTHNVFKQALRQRVDRLDDSLESEKGPNPFLEGVEAVVEAIAAGRIECRVYRRDKFHAKAYITHAKFDVVGAQALVGSSNFTQPGLTRNVELNIQVQSGREVAQLQDWFETHWDAAEDVTADVLRAITRHTAEFTPFDVYTRALHEFFRGRELTAGEWDESQSRMFGQLDRYQQEAYWSLMKIARRHGGAFLCDGVGLGKTFVGLMLIERLVLHENRRVVLFAPKAAREGVWEPHLRRWLPHVGGVGHGRGPLPLVSRSARIPRRVTASVYCSRGENSPVSSPTPSVVHQRKDLTMHAKFISQPFQYQGSKRLIAPAILQRLQLSCNSELVEPFAGSAAVSVRAALERLAGSFWINDLNEPLSNLWRAIVEDPDGLVHQYTRLWNDQKDDPRRFYCEVRDRFNERHLPADLLYLLSRAVKGAVRYNSAGHFNQSPDNRRLGTRPKELARRLSTISRALQGRIRITSIDYRDMPGLYEPGQTWYMDPPYQGVSSARDSRYSCMVVRTEFESFLGVLIDMKVPFVLSYDGKTGMKTYGPPLPAELGLRRTELDAGRSTSATLLGRTERTTEVLYLSPHLPTASIYDTESDDKQLAMTFS